MNINKALELKKGDKVICPEDRGEKGYCGKVKHISRNINKSYQGIDYIWVSVSHNNGNSVTVWPSHRIN
jgi:hypothetical protein